MTQTKQGVQTGVRRGLSVICTLMLATLPFGGTVSAQDYGPAQPADAAAAAPLMTPEQLDNLVAPVALYPDPLLSQVLVASTYPLEIVEASQWAQQNRNMQPRQLEDAARQQNWDPSIQALVAFPDVLGRMASNVEWTTDLGNAFLSQQADVMNAVQRMRAQAQASGRLASDPQQQVVTQAQDGRTVIEIVPADPQVIYVPQYNPAYIWGPPAWGYYPDLYYPAVGFGFGFYPPIYIGAYFGGWGGWGVGGWGGWGWGPNWFNCTIIGNSYFFNHYGFRNYYGRYGYAGFGRGGVWSHNPYHRMGVPYSNPRLASRFGGTYARGGGMVRGGIGGQRGGNFGGGRLQGNTQSFGQRGAGSSGGWQRFGNPGASNGQRAGAFNGSRYQTPGNRGTAGGWQRFGSPGTLNSQTRANAFSGARTQSPQFGGNTRSFAAQPGRAPVSGGSAWNRGGNFSSAPAYRGNAVRSAPAYNGGFNGRSAAPAFRQSSPSFGGGRSFGGARPSFNGGGGGGARSFGGGGARPSFSGGGGGGARSFGGGGSHGGGGGGGSHGGGHGGHR